MIVKESHILILPSGNYDVACRTEWGAPPFCDCFSASENFEEV